MTRRNRRDRPRPARKKNKKVQKGRAQAQRRMLVNTGKLDPEKKTMLHTMLDHVGRRDGADHIVIGHNFGFPDGHPASPYRAVG